MTDKNTHADNATVEELVSRLKGLAPKVTEPLQLMKQTLLQESMDTYFGERPQINSIDRRVVFEAGFDRGYLAGTGCSRLPGQKLDLKLAASRFLGWKLPKDFQPDGGIRFATNYEYESPHWPVGTNLLTYEQAVAMLEHCLEDCMESVVAVPKGYRLLKDSTIEERSWPADSAGENGNYYNTCSCCQRQFVGYKRRSMCKVCSDA